MSQNLSEEELERRKRVEDEYRRKAKEEQEEKLRIAAQEEEERLRRLERAKKEREEREAYNKSTIGEKERLIRQEEARKRKEEQDTRTRRELEKEKAKHSLQAEKYKSTRNLDISSLNVAEDQQPEESIYDKEERIRIEQLRRLAENLPVNLSYDDKLKGFDAELADKVKQKMDPHTEEKILKWIGDLVGEEVYDIGESLKSGIILCKLMNAIKPNIIPKYNLRPIALMERENITLYLKACEQIGMSKGDLFNIADLHDKKDLSLVISNLISLGKMATTISEFKGPYLELNTKTMRVKYNGAYSSSTPQFGSTKEVSKKSQSRPSIPSFTSSDPVVQFAQQQTKDLTELVDQKDQEISDLKIQVKNLNGKIESLELLQGHSEVTAEIFNLDQIMDIVTVRLKTKETNTLTNKLKKSGITDWKRLNIAVSNKGLWDKLDLPSQVKVVLQEISEKGLELQKKVTTPTPKHKPDMATGRFAGIKNKWQSTKKNFNEKITTAKSVAITGFHKCMWFVGVLTTVALLSYISQQYLGVEAPFSLNTKEL